MGTNMESLTVGLGERSYSISIGENSFPIIGVALSGMRFPKRIAVITNRTIAHIYLKSAIAALQSSGFTVESIKVPDGEQYKSLDTFNYVIEQLIEMNFDRSCGLVALGGGVVGDLVGFVAASYLRGIPFVQVPTTLLAQVDSSVGGKTAVNHALGKNLIGAFYQPKFVCIDVSTLETLLEREYVSGLAEVVKYGVIYDRNFFLWLQDNVENLSRRDHAALIHAITRSCQIKADIVERDERESSVRAILNYGHTVGHAVETLLGYGEVKHGEAVAIGMVAAARIAENLQLCSASDVAAIEHLLKQFGLPTVMPDYPLQKYLEVMYRDKKVQDGTLRLILNHGIGECEIHSVTDPRELFLQTFAQFSEEAKES